MPHLFDHRRPGLDRHLTRSRAARGITLIGLTLGLALSVAACTGSDDEEAVGVVEPVSDDDEGPDSGDDGLGGRLAGPDERTNWVGTIEPNIGITLWVAQEGTFVQGELVYDSVGEPITLLGVVNPDSGQYVLREFDPGGLVTGTLSFELPTEGRAIEGLWDDRAMTLTLDGSEPRPDDAFVPEVVAGTYIYLFPPFSGDRCCGPIGMLTISDVADDNITVAFDNVTGAPALNQAIIDSLVLLTDGNRASFDSAESGDPSFPDCAFEVTVFDGFAFVGYVDGRFDCGFGNAAGIEGAYLLVP